MSADDEIRLLKRMEEQSEVFTELRKRMKKDTEGYRKIMNYGMANDLDPRKLEDIVKNSRKGEV